MTGWADRVSIDAPADVTARMTAALDRIDPWYNLARLPKPTVIRWRYDAEMYNAQSWDDEVWVNSRVFAVDGGWEQTLAHEMAHVVDKQLMTDADRAKVMACVAGCARRVNGVCTEPLTPTWGLDLSAPYSQRCGELFAEGVSRHVWYAVVKGAGAGADLPAYGAYTFDPATAVPVMLAALAGPVAKPPVTPQAPTPTPTSPPTLEDPTMLVKKWIYAEGADLLAAMSAARASGAAVVTNRGEAAALIKAGATITVIGGPACTALALTWAVAGKATTQGAVTAVLGRDYGDGLRLALAS